MSITLREVFIRSCDTASYKNYSFFTNAWNTEVCSFDFC